jgi:hypothetical protein
MQTWAEGGSFSQRGFYIHLNGCGLHIMCIKKLKRGVLCNPQKYGERGRESHSYSRYIEDYIYACRRGLNKSGTLTPNLQVPFKCYPIFTPITKSRHSFLTALCTHSIIITS